MPDVNVTIDGHKIAVPAGTLVVEAASSREFYPSIFRRQHISVIAT